MTLRLLPDRERRHLLQFYCCPKMDYGVRLAWAGALVLAGLAVQLLWPSDRVAPMLLLSAPLLLAGNLFLLVRGYNLKPQGSMSAGQWEKTTRDRFRHVRDLEKRVKSWDETFVDVTCVSGCACLLLACGVVAFFVVFLAAVAETDAWAKVFAIDAAVILLPHWITGTRRGWRPVALRQQIDSLEVALRAIEQYKEPPCQIQPMFEMAGSGKNRTPIGARVFVRFPDGPEDFLGLQFQVALNDVQGTKYPYLYAVIVAKKSFGLLRQHLQETARRCSGLTVEASKEADVEVIVIRQHTTKTKGYHTNPAAVRRIAHAAWSSARAPCAAACR